MHPVAASPSHDAAIRAVVDLLTRSKIDFAFVGSVARAAWLGDIVEHGSIDVVAILGPEQKNQVAMMANNRGFVVDRDELAATEELDLIPLRFGGVRVHVLVASNALYGRMVADALGHSYGDLPVKIPRAEDLALLLQMNDDRDGVVAVAAAAGFDRDGYNRKLASIGLRDRMLPE